MRPSDNFQHQFQRQWSSPLKWSAIFFFVSADQRFSSSALISRWSAIFVLVSAFLFRQQFSFRQRWSAVMGITITISADQRCWYPYYTYNRRSALTKKKIADQLIWFHQRWRPLISCHNHWRWPALKIGRRVSSSCIMTADQRFSFSSRLIFFVGADRQRWSVIFFFICVSADQRFSSSSAIFLIVSADQRSGYMGITVSAHQRCYR